MSLEKALSKVQHKHVALILMVICIVIIFHPLFLPVPVSVLTTNFHNYILALKPGDKVLIAGPYGPSEFNTYRTFYKALLMSIVQQGASFVIWGGIDDPSFASSTGTSPSQDIIAQFCGFTSPPYNYKYGVNYAYLPYISGEEVAFEGLASNIRATYRYDVYGTSLDNIPLFANVNTLTDFQLCMFGEVNYQVPEMVVRQWPAKYPSVPCISYSLFSLISSFYPKYIVGDLDSFTGFAEYEYLSGTGGEFLTRMDVRDINVTVTFVLIALTNIAAFQAIRSRRKKVEVKQIGST
jgi:hypothetical protein